MNKKNLQLGLVLVALIVLAYLYQGPLQNWRSSIGIPRNFLTTLSMETIDRIEITNNSQSTIMTKEDNSWKIEPTKDLYADESAIMSLDSILQNAGKEKLELVSNNPENQADFGTDESGIQVQLRKIDGENVDFIIGNVASDGATTFIRQKDSDKTYKIQGNLVLAFDPGDWGNKQMFNLDTAQIDKVRFQYQQTTFTVEKRDDNWVGIIPYRFSVNQDKISSVINLMSSLIADAISVQSFEGTGLEKNLIIVQMSGEGLDQTIMIGDANEEDMYFAKRGDSDNIYLLSKEVRDQFELSIRGLK